MFNEVNGSHYFGWGDSQATGCYVAEAHCIDGQALAASDFGEYDAGSGIWKPKEYDGNESSSKAKVKPSGSSSR